MGVPSGLFLVARVFWRVKVLSTQGENLNICLGLRKLAARPAFALAASACAGSCVSDQGCHVPRRVFADSQLAVSFDGEPPQKGLVPLVDIDPHRHDVLQRAHFNYNPMQL